ncbi:hypothetical protein BGZ65_007526 [Modicella reniformis]|uniref:Uncharacterized protein n=1 Tax=Modicella reniformis TaxID=1440133 RepID=A0A9P6IV19_9FUNG|nr:hypothetical protein BGZ65_007526 [Modicella reniformis]
MPYFNKSRCLDYKDAFVALCGIWNTFSSAANEAFVPSKLQEVLALSGVQEMDKTDPEVDELVKVLVDTLKAGALAEVLEKTYDLQSRLPSLRRVLHVIQIMEQGCAAAALSKSKFEAVFDTGSSPRKYDYSLTVGSVEVGNFDCKKAGSPKIDVASQLRKNMKVNKSILLELERYKMECPLLLSIHGLSATIFKIAKYEDIWVGAKACEPIILPENPEEFEYFLSDHLQRLTNLLDHYDKYSRDTLRAVNKYNFSRRAAEEEDQVDKTSQNILETLEWEHVVLHTPTKPAKPADPIGEVEDSLG